MEWTPYDPGWLVELARESRPDAPWLGEALAGCTLAARDGRAYLRFADSAFPDEPASEWQVEESILLHHPREGGLVLDVVRGRRIGGVEFLKRL